MVNVLIPEPCFIVSMKRPSFTPANSSSLDILPGSKWVVVIRTIGSNSKLIARAFPVASSPRAAAVTALCRRPASFPFLIRVVFFAGVPSSSKGVKELPAYMPFFKHSLVAEHEVGLALMAEGFMGENTGGQRRKNHGVFSGLYPL